MEQQKFKTNEGLSDFLYNFYSTDLILSFYSRNLQQKSPDEFLVEARQNTESVRKLIDEQYELVKSIQLLEIWKFEIGKYLTNLISVSIQLETNKDLQIIINNEKDGKELTEAQNVILQTTNWLINYFTLVLLNVMHKVAKDKLESKNSENSIRGILLSPHSANPIDQITKLNTFITKLISHGYIAEKDSIQMKRLFLGENLTQKINWLGQGNELGYMFEKLNNPELNIITRSSDSNEIWKRIAQCFYIKGLDKKALDFNQNHTPKKPHLRRLIDGLINELISK